MKIPVTTGRFGTGFLTTYLLSKRVIVDGIFQSDEEYRGKRLFKKFQLLLNRDKKDVNKMIFYNKKSSEVFENLDDDNTWPFLNNYEAGIDLDTCFTYYLDEIGNKNAQEGIENLKICLPYVLIFNKRIG